MTHTQGPWRVTGNSIRSDNHIDGTGALLLAAGPMFHAYEPDPEEQTANLKLAAAAPAMLKALQAWISLAERSSMDGIDHEVAMTEAAIAKATTEHTGEAHDDRYYDKHIHPDNCDESCDSYPCELCPGCDGCEVS